MVWGHAAEFRTSKEGFIAFAKEFNEIGKRIKDNGLRFVYHNHKFEFESLMV